MVSSVKWRDSTWSLNVFSISKVLSVLSPSSCLVLGIRRDEGSWSCKDLLLGFHSPKTSASDWQESIRDRLVRNREVLSPFIRSREEQWWERTNGKRRGGGREWLKSFWHMTVVLLCTLLHIPPFGKLSFPTHVLQVRLLRSSAHPCSEVGIWPKLRLSVIFRGQYGWWGRQQQIPFFGFISCGNEVSLELFGTSLMSRGERLSENGANSRKSKNRNRRS